MQLSLPAFSRLLHFVYNTEERLFRGFQKKKRRKHFEKILDFTNLIGFFMFHTYVYNESLDGSGLKAKQTLKNNLNADNENDGI